MPGVRPHLPPEPPGIRTHAVHTLSILCDHYRRNRYLTPNWTVLADDAELPRPKKGELNTPTIWVTLTRLIALNMSTVRSKLSRLFPPRRCATLKVFARRTSSCTVRGPRPVLRVTPGGRSLATVSPLSSNPVVTLNGEPLTTDSTSPV